MSTDSRPKMCMKVICWSFCCMISFVCCIPTMEQKPSRAQRVCVIGAGLAGLSSARYLKEEGLNFTVYESTQFVGGTWRYDPRVGTDENGLPIHTSMYKHLRTNVPKPKMELRGFPLPKDFPMFPCWKMYYDYIKDYTKHFDIQKYIKFLHHVVSVKRVADLWKVKYVNVKTKEEFEEDYDFIIIGTGHNSKPNLPNIPGENLFKGTIIHSHDYREPDQYNGRRVLTVGAGPSGVDISRDIAEACKTLIHSHHTKIDPEIPFPKNYIRKPDVKEFNETGAVFEDGSFEELDDVVYCTGFQYQYPFLDESSGLSFTPRSVVPLYKYMVNIHQPTMVFVGLIIRAIIVIAIDAQARYAVALAKGNFTLPLKEDMLSAWQKQADAIVSEGRPISDIHDLGQYQARYAIAPAKGNFTLPAKEDMLSAWQKQADDIVSEGRPISDIHVLGQYQAMYYGELTKESGIERVSPVLFERSKIRAHYLKAKLDKPCTYGDHEDLNLKNSLSD